MILLTGATGFIGKYIIDQLLKIYDKDDIVLLSSEQHPFIATIVYHDGIYESIDLNSFQNIFNQVEYIIHAGAFIPKNGDESGNIIKNSNSIINTSFLFTIDFKALKKVIFLSTVDVYETIDLLTEETGTIPSTLYGWSKLYCEEVVKMFCKMKNVKYQIFRIGHVFGPGEEVYQKIMPITFNRIRENKDLEIYGSGEELRNFIYVEDVAKAIILPIESDFEDNVINIVGEKSVSIIDIVNLIIKITGSSVSLNYTNSAFRGKDYVFDNTRFIKNCKPEYTSLEAGLRNEWIYLRDKI